MYIIFNAYHAKPALLSGFCNPGQSLNTSLHLSITGQTPEYQAVLMIRTVPGIPGFGAASGPINNS